MPTPTTRHGREVDPLDGLPSIEAVAEEPRAGLISLHEIRCCLGSIAREIILIRASVVRQSRVVLPPSAAAPPPTPAPPPAVETTIGAPVPVVRAHAVVATPPARRRQQPAQTSATFERVKEWMQQARGPVELRDLCAALGASPHTNESQCVRNAADRVVREKLARREQIPADEQRRHGAKGRPSTFRYVWNRGAS